MYKLQMRFMLIAATCLATTISFSQPQTNLKSILNNSTNNSLSAVPVLTPDQFKGEVSSTIQKIQQEQLERKNSLRAKLGASGAPASPPGPPMSNLMQKPAAGSNQNPTQTEQAAPPAQSAASPSAPPTPAAPQPSSDQDQIYWGSSQSGASTGGSQSGNWDVKY
jgi:hypothetical protein